MGILISSNKSNIAKQYVGKSFGKSYTADDLINAWEDGKMCGRNEIIELLNNTRKVNTKKAINYCTELFELLKNQNIKCGAIFLKDENVKNMTTLIMVDENDFIKDEFLKVIREIDKFTNKSIDNSFYINYKIMPSFDEINEDIVVSDGYTVLYDGQIKIHRSRKS